MKFATPFFIISRESHRRYWFLHLANSPKANDVVKELHWGIENHFSHHGDAGLSMLGFDPHREPAPGQLSFAFDATAKRTTHEALLVELPRRIGGSFADGVPFAELFAAVTNETPASKDMVHSVLTELCQEGELSKRGGDGENRKPETSVRGGDIIVPSRQMRMPWSRR